MPLTSNSLVPQSIASSRSDAVKPAAARSGASSGLAKSVNAVANTCVAAPREKRAMLVMGDGETRKCDWKKTLTRWDYVSDALLIADELTRIAANPNKSLANYPLVFETKAALAEFETCRKKISDGEFDERPNKESESARRDFYMYALKHASTAWGPEFDWSSCNKIYLPSHRHCEPGVAQLKIDDQKVEMPEIAKRMAAMKIPQDIRDVRLRACNSADVKKIQTLSHDLSVEACRYTQLTWHRPVWPLSPVSA